jgi:uncharacterized membrane protein
MKLSAIELLVEFAVILLAPIIHTFYLWKYKNVEKNELIKNAKIFAVLYVLIGLVGIMLIIKDFGL